MRGEAPRFKRCCFCIPLRRGLLAWGYLILALNLLMAVFFTVTLLYFSQMIILLPSIMLVVLDVIFSVLLIVACHKKSPKLLQIYFVYGIVVAILTFVLTSVIIYDELQKAVSTWNYSGEVVIGVVATPATCFIEIFISIYVLFLVRSERLKLLEQNLEMQFVNNETEARSYCVCVADADPCARIDPSAPVTDTALCDT